jgi:hypothetical protein
VFSNAPLCLQAHFSHIVFELLNPSRCDCVLLFGEVGVAVTDLRLLIATTAGASAATVGLELFYFDCQLGDFVF